VTLTAQTASDVVIGVQSLLYDTPITSIERMLAALDNSSMIGLREHRCSGFVVTLGDGSSRRVLEEADVARLQAAYPHIHNIRYHWFGYNIGTAGGHNAMVDLLPEPTHVIFSNPDVVVEPRAIWRMLEAFDDPDVGFVEAKQLPIEHPKDFASRSGLTGWATTAFAMTPKTLFKELEGFDAESFFMYCDDVDYSWRVREANKKVIYQAGAVVFHDKYLSLDGDWQPTSAEVRYSAEAALFLADKWSRPALVESLLKTFEDPKMDSVYHEAAKKYRRRRRRGLLVERRDPEKAIGYFKNSRYAEHRFPL
jgi:GT2 family glycosyltransferase